MTAPKECLELYLCSHLNFWKGATESAPQDKGLRRGKPLAWILTRLPTAGYGKGGIV
jgi:hypothetical protein